MYPKTFLFPFPHMSLLLASATLNVLKLNSWAADLERDLNRIREDRPVLGMSYCSDTHRDRQRLRKRGGEGLWGRKGCVGEI